MAVDYGARLTQLRTEFELVLAGARADFEEAERELARKRATLVDAEMAFRRATTAAATSTRPRHLLGRERRGPMRRPLDGLQIVAIEPVVTPDEDG